MFSSKYFTLGSQVVSQKISIELLENKLLQLKSLRHWKDFVIKTGEKWAKKIRQPMNKH